MVFFKVDNHINIFFKLIVLRLLHLVFQVGNQPVVEMLARSLRSVLRASKNAKISAHTFMSSSIQASSLNSVDEFTSTGNMDDSASKTPNTFSSHASIVPLIERDLQYKHMFNEQITPPRQAWLETFNSPDALKLSLIPLHPSVFAGFPRPDLINRNVSWQQRIHSVNYLHLKTRAEMPSSSKKPWPQKGTGRARHGSRRGPQWRNGGWCNGPRGPMTRYFLLPFFTRVRGLISTLSAKFAQNDIKIIDRLDNFPSDEPEVLVEFVEKRQWGPSVLIVDKSDVFPRNIALASHNIDHINLMPVYGLNVHSMLKHETLVFTLDALNELEEKLLFHFNRTDLDEIIYKHESPPIIPKDYPEHEGARWWTNMHQNDW